jgi:rfaE bifunctional protein nucleotidyltransferase chain/domain
MNPKLQTLRELRAQTPVLRASGARLVLTNGCFDLLHVGHVRFLQAARRLGEFLVVAVNSDASVQALKGPERPLVPDVERAEVLAALASVDAVLIFESATAEAVVAALRPDVYVKGDDYTEAQLPEAQTVRTYGGQIAILPTLPGRSTTALVDRIRSIGDH